jgi:hypothetical protein
VASNEAARLTGSLAPTSRRSTPAAYRFLSSHQAAVLDIAARCLNPTPPPHLVAYVDRLLSQLDSPTSPRRVRIADLRDQYANGIALLDKLADGDFTMAPRLSQQLILSHTQVAPFAGLLFDHLVEAVNAPPVGCTATLKRRRRPAGRARLRPR